MAKKEKAQDRAGRRMIVVPVCQRYQAVVPTWNGPVAKGLAHDAAASKRETKGIDHDNAASKPHTKSLDLDTAASSLSASTSEGTMQWLGTKTWPLEGKKIGEGGDEAGRVRLDACGCGAPGSVDCRRLHSQEERERLRTELGPAFDSWNFEKMGEAVAAGWTEEQQRRFENIVKRNPPSQNKNFLEPAMAAFSKTRDEVVSYYFNVYLPRKFCTGEVQDSDGEDTKRKSTRSKAKSFLLGSR
ncbi:hypothetical protein Droror1_Dr00004258 [Drosera rotundifolia]